MVKLIATWNNARAVWEQPSTSLLCGHSVPFSQVWPSSGTMQNGIAYERQTPGRLTTANGYSYLPTPMVSDTYSDNLKSTQHTPGSMHSVTLAQVVRRSDLLPTPLANSYKGAGEPEIVAGDPKHRIAVAAEIINRSNSWGRYEPAIRQWEQTINTPAPAPTIADGRDGNHRLSAEFAEWLMGIPGRLDGLDLTRTERLKMAGNGVCPQQAVMALTILLERVHNEQVAR